MHSAVITAIKALLKFVKRLSVLTYKMKVTGVK